MPGASKISRTLDHLAWLRKQLSADINGGNAYAGALLTYNAAAALQWQFVLPASSMDTVRNAPDRAKAATIIDDFVWRARDLFNAAKKLSKKGREGKAGRTILQDLRSAIASVLRKLPPLLGFGSTKMEPDADLMRSLDPIAMLKDWLTSRGLAVKATTAALKKAGLTGPRAGLRSALAHAMVVADESVYGPRGKEYRKGSSEVVSAMLGHALKDYVATLDRKSAKRMDAFVQDVISDINALHAD
jgi:hypothetical protein